MPVGMIRPAFQGSKTMSLRRHRFLLRRIMVIVIVRIKVILKHVILKRRQETGRPRQRGRSAPFHLRESA
jgi:hypothetical protein